MLARRSTLTTCSAMTTDGYALAKSCSRRHVSCAHRASKISWFGLFVLANINLSMSDPLPIVCDTCLAPGAERGCGRHDDDLKAQSQSDTKRDDTQTGSVRNRVHAFTNANRSPTGNTKRQTLTQRANREIVRHETNSRRSTEFLEELSTVSTEAAQSFQNDGEEDGATSCTLLFPACALLAFSAHSYCKLLRGSKLSVRGCKRMNN